MHRLWSSILYAMKSLVDLVSQMLAGTIWLYFCVPWPHGFPSRSFNRFTEIERKTMGGTQTSKCRAMELYGYTPEFFFAGAYVFLIFDLETASTLYPLSASKSALTYFLYTPAALDSYTARMVEPCREYDL